MKSNLRAITSKVLALMIVAFLFANFAAFTPVKAAPLSVTLTSHFGPVNPVPTNGLEGEYGSKLSFDASLASQAGYTFAYWIVNGRVREDLPITHEFYITEGITLDAIFTNTGEYAGLFMDSNLQVIGVEFANAGNSFTLTDVGFMLPDKPGYSVTSPKWDHLLTAISANTVFTLQYEANAALDTYDITAVNGTGGGTFDFDTIVTVTADAPLPGLFFTGWEENGLPVSYDESYSFTALEDRTVTATYGNTPPIEEAFIFLSSDLHIRPGYRTFMGTMVIPEGYSIIEFGMVTFGDVHDPNSVNVYQGSNYNGQTGEFVMSFSGGIEGILPFMTLDNGNGGIESFEDNPYVLPLEVFISEYIEGSGNNKAIELYNPTSTPITLTGYELELYGNGSSTSTNVQDLSSHTIQPYSTLVFTNSGAGATLKAVETATSSIANFNGDDAVALLKDNVVIDQFGVIGTDPGSSWPVGTDSTENHTLVRDSSINHPSATWNPSEWIAYDIDTFDYIGSHTMNGHAPIMVPSILGMANASITAGDTYTPLTGVTASDFEDGDLTGSITYTVLDSTPALVPTPGDFSTLAAGTYSVIYSVTDSDSNTVTETITLTINAAVAGVLYSTGFEAAEGFTSTSTYNNSTPNIDGPIGQQWSFVSGTPSTTSPLTGSMSGQLRYYNTAPGNIGYFRTEFLLSNPDNIVFNAASQSTIDVEVSYSYDKITWFGQEIFDLDGTTTEYTYDMSTFTLTGDVYIMFQMTFSTPPSHKARLYLDDVVINSAP